MEGSSNTRGQFSGMLRARENVGQSKDGEVDRAWRHSGEGFDLQPKGSREPLEDLELGSDMIGYVL